MSTPKLPPRHDSLEHELRLLALVLDAMDHSIGDKYPANEAEMKAKYDFLGFLVWRARDYLNEIIECREPFEPETETPTVPNNT